MRDDARTNMGLRLAGVSGSGADSLVPDYDQAIAGAGLTVAGSGMFSYPGEGLVRDGLSDLAGAIHNI